MKKQTFTALILAGMIGMSGCSAADTADTASDTAAETTTTAAETAPAETSASSKSARVASTDSEPEEYGYVHGEEGYFSLEDELPGFKKRPQIGGTCWLYAAAASMQTAYEKKTGTTVDIEPLDLLNLIYDNNAEEGAFIKGGGNGRDIGGWQWLVTERLSRGFGDLTLDSSLQLDPADIDGIKEAVRTRGAVAVAIYDLTNDYKSRFGKYYTTNFNGADKDGYDHDVAVIGWDDNFPKEYFRYPAEENGAWIVYNSSLGADDLYYISYESPFGEAISHTMTDEYSAVLSYDAGNELDRCLKTGDTTKTGNVFHIESEGQLAAVGTYNDFDEQDITIEIYDAGFGEVLYTQQAKLDFKGYHTIKLDTPVDVKDFAVVMTYTKGAPIEGEPMDYYDIGEYRVTSAAGQSYVFLDGEWKDLSEKDINKKLGCDFVPNNACIKALMAK